MSSDHDFGCKSFPLPGSRDHFPPDRPIRARKLRLELGLDFDRRCVSGSAIHRVVVVRPVSVLTFDAVELDVSNVLVNEQSAGFSNDGRQLHVHLAAPAQPGEELKVDIAYAAHPRRGLYFLGPDTHYPKRPRQAWTQGQDEDNRCWFPCLDTPGQKAFTEIAVEVPASMLALSNGKLLDTRELDDRRRFHYRLDHPHSPYLVTLVAGEFERQTEMAGDVELAYLVPRGREEDAKRAFANTKEMLELFGRLIGHPYPYPSYSQVCVADFIFGGMENTTATTLTENTLHDARAHLDYSSDPLVSHELAHQWFGDLLTCRDWPHGWLNEGFATYFEVLWKEHKEGRDEADKNRADDLALYLEEFGQRYGRAIVERRYEKPVEIFDRHLYEKGGLVLHELRRRLGDEQFFAGLKLYVERHREGVVETQDLARALEEVSGRSLGRFFEQYVHRPGHPQLEIEAAWKAEEKLLRLRVQQKQKLPKDEAPYELSLPVRVVNGTGAVVHQLELHDRDQTIFLRCDEEPKQLVVDPRRDALCTLEVKKPVAMWLEELKSAPEGRARMAAAKALGKDGSVKALAAVREALLHDGFWAVQAEAARALGEAKGTAARDALLEGLKLPHPKARRAVVKALGNFRGDAKVASAMEALLDRGDDSYFVESESARQTGKLRTPRALELLKRAMERESFTDVIRVGALDGLAELRAPEGYGIAREYTRLGHSEQVRGAACHALAKLAEPARQPDDARELLCELAEDGMLRVSVAALDALGDLGDRKALGTLRRVADRALDGRVRRKAREVEKELRESARQNKEVADLRDELQKLRDEVRELREKVAARESRS